MTDRVVIKTGIEIEYGIDDHRSIEHPFRDKSFEEIKEHIAAVEKEFGGYTDLKYELEWKYYKGAYDAWYDLTGVPSPLIKALG